MNDIMLKEEAGLLPCGQVDGKKIYIGTDKQWENYERLKDEVENQGLRWGAYDAHDIQRVKNGEDF